MTQNKAYFAQVELNKYCEKIWSFAPSDRDCDGIIDNVLGGCGAASGMLTHEFIDEMNSKLEEDEVPPSV